MMKQYTKQKFNDGTEYITATPKGYPDWWSEFKGIVETSHTIENLSDNLMEFNPVPTVPQDIHGQTVFNPLMVDFLIHNPEYLKTFNKGHKEGLKHFKKNYFKKYPNSAEVEVIFNKYNNDFKESIWQGVGTFNYGTVLNTGFRNGILTAYWDYEINQLKEHGIPITEPLNKPQPALQQNEYPKIFKNDFGFTLFNEMHQHYKDERTLSAHYGFLFYAMEKEFLICSQTEFVRFLGHEVYDIQIDKIDSRYSGKNKKSKLYNSEKDRLQEKHGLSTV